MVKNSKTVQKRADEKNPISKTFSLVFYPEDYPSLEYSALFSLFDCKVWLSPLHDKDVYHLSDIMDGKEYKERYTDPAIYAETVGFEPEKFEPSLWLGIPKKAHYHAVFHYSGSVRLNAFRGILAEAFRYFGFDNPPYAISCNSQVKAVEYLIHYNNPEKYRYDRDAIRLFNGANFKRCFTDFGDTDLIALLDLIAVTGISEYNRLYMYLRVNRPDLISCFMARDNTMQIQNMLRSNHFCPVEAFVPDLCNVYDKNTGEILTVQNLVLANNKEVHTMRLGGTDNESYVNSYFSSLAALPPESRCLQFK